ncbi:hypothetical protein EBZ80_02385 [bacterium]|nr:hypothetical protein [bacterium]
MSIYCLLNSDKYRVEFQKFYNPILLVDVKKYQMKCEMNNSFLFFIENPRINIDLVSGFFEFYFRIRPQDFTLGQVMSKTLITYNTSRKNNPHEFMPCVLFTSGMYLQEILVYLPYQTFAFHRELVYHFVPRIDNQCSVCLEEKQCINVHDNVFNHCVCPTCLLRIEPKCPVCRLAIH